MKKYIPKEYWKDLMFMGYSDDISLYKHCNTRRYVNVDKEGNFYLYNGNTYDKVEKEFALEYLIS